MNFADTLAGPGLLALLIAIPIGCALTALGRKGVPIALGGLVLLVAGNLLIASNVSEFGAFGAGVTVTLGFFGLIPILIGWHVGSFLRERAQAKRALSGAFSSG